MIKGDLAYIVKKGSVITLITIFSRPLGYIREAIQAYVFGATVLVDAFVVAFNFPELIQTIFFSGAISALLVPICTKYVKDEIEFSRVYSTFVNITLFLTGLFSLLVLLLSEQVVKVIAPGFSPHAKTVTRNLFLIMLPVISTHGVLSVMKSFLNAKDHFAAPELSGIIWNLVFIFSCLFLSKTLGIYSLAIGVSVGSFFQILLQYPFLRKLKIEYRPEIKFSHESVKEAKRLFFGAVIGASILPINSFVDRILASFLPEGHVASLAYAFRIFVLPSSLFAVPIYTVSFSSISRSFHERDWKALFSRLESSINLLFITLIPSSCLLCGLKSEIVTLLYERGAFTTLETELTSKALLGYGVGLLFYGLSVLFVRAFSSIHDTRTPAIVGITSIFLNGLLDIILMIPYKNFGIALATSIVSFYNFLLLFLLWRKKTGYGLRNESLILIGKSILSGLIILIVVGMTKRFFQNPVLLVILDGFCALSIVYFLFRGFFHGTVIPSRP